jgi:hypothetical protein
VRGDRPQPPALHAPLSVTVNRADVPGPIVAEVNDGTPVVAAVDDRAARVDAHRNG